MPRTATPRDEIMARLRPARPGHASRGNPAPRVADTLVTALLVLYPALGTVGVIIAGLLLSGGDA